jgi:hypothetical protein
MVPLVSKYASRLDLMGRLALFFFVVKFLKKLRTWMNPKQLNDRSHLLFQKKINQHPHAHPLFRHFLPSRDCNLWLFTKWWLPPAHIHVWKGVFFIVHGFNEHIHRYEYAAQFLAQQGYAVFGMDHQVRRILLINES